MNKISRNLNGTFKEGHMGHMEGKHHSEETKRKIGLGNKGKILSEKTKQKISKAHAGKKLSKEHRASLSKSHIGQNAWNKGKKMNKEYCERMKRPRISRRQSKSHQWSGGKKTNADGYIAVISPDCKPNDKAKFILEHRLVAEEAMGRKLKREEIVHHINGDKRNNRNSNLLICTQSYHRFLHGKMSYLYMREHYGSFNG